MSRLINADDLIAELEAACMPIHYDGLSGITGSTDTIAEIIDKMAEKEPAPTAIGTSSEVSKDTGSILQFDDSTKRQACQALKATKRAMEEIIDVYQAMPEEEQRAFDLGESYGQLLTAADSLEKLRKRLCEGGEKND